METKQYIGPLEVQAVNDTEDEHIVRVDYTNGTWEDLNRKVYEACLSKEPYDLTTLRDRRMQLVAAAVLEALKEYNIKIDEIEYLNTLVMLSLTDNLTRANASLWRREGETQRDLANRTMLDVDKIIKGDLK